MGLSYSAWILAARPKTLTAAVVPVVVATALAFNAMRLSDAPLFPWPVGVLALACALLIQIGTNYINDACDFLRGADTGDRLGPQRAVAGGFLSPQAMARGGAVCFALALALGVPLVIHGGLPILLIGILSIISGYLYTGGPRPLAYSGLGEVFVLLFFGFVAVCGLFYLYTGAVSLHSLVAGFQIGSLATALIAINNLRDYISDRHARKLTLIARYGPGWGRWEVAVFVLAPFLCSMYWIGSGYVCAATFPLITMPLAISIIRAVYRIEPSQEYNLYLGKAALVHALFGAALSVGILCDGLV